ncbi:peptidoglycan-binding protein [Streptomyces syringium]|uniref:peptidoglycan-binding protein n=1 Tax=Streptomyces syringium TaxID=76729 RepID=UPI0036D086FD
MAKPLSADRLVEALRQEGVKVREHRSWRTHNRNGKGAWGPVHGVVIHHTVTSGTEASVDLCYDGYSELPGPLCHGVIAKDGTVYLVGNGRSNHAGLGDGDVLNAVIEERSLPAPNENNTDGNARFYGFECINLGDGEDPWPAAQLEAIEKVSAAICRAHGWTERSVIGHKEWTNNKIDPKGFTMSSMRSRIADCLKGKPGGPGPQPKPPQYEPFPGADFFRAGRNSPVITAMGKRLVAEGCGRYEEGPGPEWTEADRKSYAAWQRKLGYSGSDADGTPGRTSWTKLRVPNV